MKMSAMGGRLRGQGDASRSVFRGWWPKALKAGGHRGVCVVKPRKRPEFRCKAGRLAVSADAHLSQKD